MSGTDSKEGMGGADKEDEQKTLILFWNHRGKYEKIFKGNRGELHVYALENL